MSGFTFDSNIVIDLLAGFAPARDEFVSAAEHGQAAWVSRMVWIEVLSKGTLVEIEYARQFMTGLAIDEIDEAIALRAAALRRERPRLKSPDAIILATAQLRGRTLITRNTKDFAAGTPGIRVPYTL